MGKRWTEADLRNLRPGMVGNIPGVSAMPTAEPAKKKKAPKKEPQALVEMKAWLRILKVDFVTELIFHPTRKWRFDIAIPAHKLAIEYEGIVAEKSRHTTLPGYTEDCRKYTEAQKLGWRVFRYTQLNYEEFMKDITDVIEIPEV